jgi:hypothetical protein
LGFPPQTGGQAGQVTESPQKATSIRFNTFIPLEGIAQRLFWGCFFVRLSLATAWQKWPPPIIIAAVSTNDTSGKYSPEQKKV